jgi:hypothetical protein
MDELPGYSTGNSTNFCIEIVREKAGSLRDDKLALIYRFASIVKQRAN